MKRVVIFLGLTFIPFLCFTQIPRGMTFQAIAYDEDNQRLVNQTIGVRFTFLRGSTVLYAETQSPTTNLNGLFSIVIGSGEVEAGKFDEINWKVGNISLRREYNMQGGTNYNITGEEFLYPVPYAQYAANSGPSFTIDAHGQFIPTIQVDTLEWMATNLSVTAYNDGTLISDSDVFVYGGDKANAHPYGRLYSWAAVSSSKLCPMGWRMPTKGEWEKLMVQYSGTEVKAVVPAWANYSNNRSGFSAQPGGSADGLGNYSGTLGITGHYWTATENIGGTAWSVTFIPGTEEVIIDDSFDKTVGLSVRCVR
jgi:uncharacterized protein (TIGR02145 family)